MLISFISRAPVNFLHMKSLSLGRATQTLHVQSHVSINPHNTNVSSNNSEAFCILQGNLKEKID